jgi:ribosomal protein L3 glutamine methyltransferase
MARTPAQRNRTAPARRPARDQRRLPSVEEIIRSTAQRFDDAKLFYGHGTANAIDEAAAIVFHALQLDHARAQEAYARRVPGRAQARIEQLVRRRIEERIPAAYLTKRMWFAGLEFDVDERVLVPRSPLAELIEKHFAPWIEARRVRAILDIGTGCGCIAIASALAFPRASVDAVDISAPALAVARRNIRRHGVERRVRALRSDHFGALAGRQYDIIVSNPPYVDAADLRALPAEYRHEPKLALASGPDGLDAVRVILAGAAEHLRKGGILVVEVGNSQHALERAFPPVPFAWLEFERGGGGVFVLTAEQLVHHGVTLRRMRARTVRQRSHVG